MTLSPAFRNSFANAYPIPESYEKYNTATENELDKWKRKFIKLGFCMCSRERERERERETITRYLSKAYIHFKVIRSSAGA